MSKIKCFYTGMSRWGVVEMAQSNISLRWYRRRYETAGPGRWEEYDGHEPSSNDEEFKDKYGTLFQRADKIPRIRLPT